MVRESIDEFQRQIAENAEPLLSGRMIEREAAIGCYVELGVQLRAYSRELLKTAVADTDGHLTVDEPLRMSMYEQMIVFGLLEHGWGAELYDKGQHTSHSDIALFCSLIDVWQATALVMQGYDLNRRAVDAMHLHLNTLGGRKASKPWWDDLRRILDIGPSHPRVGSRDEPDEPPANAASEDAATPVEINDPGAVIGVAEYVAALIDWRFDSRAEPSYWIQRARLTERLLGISDQHRLISRVIDQLPSVAIPDPWSGNLSQLLEAPEEFVIPGLNARERRLFEQSRNTYRQALTEYLNELIDSLCPDARLRFTTLGALWDLGLPRNPGRVPSAADEFD